MQPSDPKNAQKAKTLVPETIGATSEPFTVGTGPVRVSFEIHPPSGPALRRPDGQPRRILLRVENVKSKAIAPTLSIYMNLPPGEDPARSPESLAFEFSTFGLMEASRPRGNHPANGLSDMRDVTAVVSRLITAGRWDSKAVSVTIVPDVWKGPVNIQVGRISLLLE